MVCLANRAEEPENESTSSVMDQREEPMNSYTLSRHFSVQIMTAWPCRTIYGIVANCTRELYIRACGSTKKENRR